MIFFIQYKYQIEYHISICQLKAVIFQAPSHLPSLLDLCVQDGFGFLEIFVIRLCWGQVTVDTTGR